jgi:hypothetical protein
MVATSAMVSPPKAALAMKESMDVPLAARRDAEKASGQA